MGYARRPYVLLLARLLVANRNFVHDVSCQLLEQVIDVRSLQSRQNLTELTNLVQLTVAMEQVVHIGVPNIVKFVESHQLICFSAF